MDFARRFVRESALIEGQVIPDGRLDSSGHMRAYLYAVGLADAKEMIQESDIKNMQMLVAGEQHLWGDRRFLAEELGKYRTHAIAIGLPDGTIKPIGAKGYEVPTKMREIIQVVWNWPLFVKGHSGMVAEDDPASYAARVHWRFERVHPFADGNGRTGRLLTAYMMRIMDAAPILFTNWDKSKTYYPCFEDSTPERMIEYFRTHQMPDVETDGQRIVGVKE